MARRRTRSGLNNRYRYGTRNAPPRVMEVSILPPYVPPPPDPPIVRIHHPAIRSSGRRVYRVIRAFLRAGHQEIEDIGEFRELGPALAMARREISYVRILDPKGKVVHLNWQPMEIRE